MTVRSMDVNTWDKDGMTTLDILRQRPRSEPLEIITRHHQEYAARRVVASHLRMQSMGGSPGSCFKISDLEIFLYTGIENASNGGSEGLMNTLTTEVSQPVESLGQTSKAANYGTQRLKRLLQWAKIKKRDTERLKKTAAGHQSPAVDRDSPTPTLIVAFQTTTTSDHHFVLGKTTLAHCNSQLVFCHPCHRETLG